MAPYLLFAGAKVCVFYQSYKFILIFIDKMLSVSEKYSIFAPHLRKLMFNTSPRTVQSGCSAVGSALRSGRRGRAFESPHPDKMKGKRLVCPTFFLFVAVLMQFFRGSRISTDPGYCHNVRIDKKPSSMTKADKL